MLESLLITLLKGIAGFLKFYQLLATIRIYCSWFPNINMYMQPFLSLKKLTDPFLLIFRGLIPNILGFDLSPILGFLLLTSLQDICNSIVGINGLPF
jgi:YggT family protein